jgi:hypothetical protein
MLLLRPSSIDQLTECLDSFKQLRTSQPVWYDEETNSWNLVCYQEVLQVFADTSSYVLLEAVGATSADPAAAGPLIPRTAERLLGQVLTPRSVSELSSPDHTWLDSPDSCQHLHFLHHSRPSAVQAVCQGPTLAQLLTSCYGAGTPCPGCRPGPDCTRHGPAGPEWGATARILCSQRAMVAGGGRRTRFDQRSLFSDGWQLTRHLTRQGRSQRNGESSGAFAVSPVVRCRNPTADGPDLAYVSLRSNPRERALATAWVRFLAPSFSRMVLT